MADTASVQPESGWIMYASSNFPHWIWFHFFLQRRHRSYCAKPTWIHTGWPGQGLAKCVWSGSKPVCRNHQAQCLAGCHQPAASFPTLRLGCVLPRTAWILLSNIVLAGCVRFWPNRSGPEASWCGGIIQPTSGPCFGADPDWILHVYCA